MKLKFLLVAAALVLCTELSAKEAKLLRFPAIHGTTVVFSYAGDLYSVNSNGGVARRLTSDIGYEMMPRFSPDGKQIAFTGQYDGNTEVFVIPSEGGEPVRLTHTATLSRDDIGDRMGPNNLVIDWTPDGKNVTYRSRARSFSGFTGQLYNVPISGGLSVEVPLKNGGLASWSPDGSKIAYNYIFREFRTWKRYQGGMADDLRIFDSKSNKSERITENNAQDIAPMWTKDGKTVYYISDRDNVMNLYAYDVASKGTKQITFYKDYDIKFPSIGSDYIVYEYAGCIYKYDLKAAKTEKITIEINNDKSYARPVWMNLSRSTSSHNISPDGKTLALTARGDIFFVPAKEGVTKNITNSSNANDKMGIWAPSGEQFAYVSDKSGEFHIYIYDLKTQTDKQLTKNIKTAILNLKFSPDSKKVLWADKNNSLSITDIATGDTKLVERSGAGTLTDSDWAGDSRWIAYTRPGKEMSDIVLYDNITGKKIVVTDGWFGSRNPKFSRDGKYLFFTSARVFNPTYGSTEFNHIYQNMSKIYFIPLSAKTPSPFIYSDNDKKDDGKISVTPLEVDEQGIKDRVIDLPLNGGSYSLIAVVDNKVYYSTRGTNMVYDLNKKSDTDLGVRVSFSSDYKKVLAVSGGNMEVMSPPSSKVTLKDKIDLSNVVKYVDYSQEWAQIYDETWRQMRDYFYDKNMHGVDWNMIKKKYEVFLPYIGHRSDLTYILGEMIAELNVGHAYSQNGEAPTPDRVKMGLLGAQFSRDKSGAFKISKILKGGSWDSAIRSPFTEIGINVKEGDYILAIDGVSTKNSEDIYTLLANKANKYVELTINKTPVKEGSRNVVVKTISDESELYYYNWVEANMEKVSKATNGKVGYIHIPDMGAKGLNEFVKHYYPQLNKEALIIDDRGNGGGNVSPMITERLLRTPTFYTMHTNQTEGSANPTGTFIGPKVLLVNEYSASDGDLFPYRFKYNNLGTIIGRRTWGGVVGYSGMIPVVDGGSIVTPSYAPYAVDGSGFIIEGVGVEPDINIENDPYQDFIGNDQQLNKAIEVVLEKLKTEKKEFTPIPKFPNKSAK